jgi:GNAT superfamily N-acetyltransferase
VELREPREDDWPAILDLADRSVRAVAGAGAQEEWLHNRQRPSGPQRHFVAVEAGALVGYASIESPSGRAERGVRLFVVAPPERLAEIGSLLYEQIESVLPELRAEEAWLVEYAGDRKLLAFLAERGFRETRRFRLEDGVECVVVSKRLGGT